MRRRRCRTVPATETCRLGRGDRVAATATTAGVDSRSRKVAYAGRNGAYPQRSQFTTATQAQARHLAVGGRVRARVHVARADDAPALIRPLTAPARDDTPPYEQPFSSNGCTFAPWSRGLNPPFCAALWPGRGERLSPVANSPLPSPQAERPRASVVLACRPTLLPDGPDLARPTGRKLVEISTNVLNVRPRARFSGGGDSFWAGRAHDVGLGRTR